MEEENFGTIALISPFFYPDIPDILFSFNNNNNNLKLLHESRIRYYEKSSRSF